MSKNKKILLTIFLTCVVLGWVIVIYKFNAYTKKLSSDIHEMLKPDYSRIGIKPEEVDSLTVEEKKALAEKCVLEFNNKAPPTYVQKLAMITILNKLGPIGTDALVHEAFRPGGEYSWQIEWAFENYGPKVVAPLMEILETQPNPAIRAKAGNLLLKDVFKNELSRDQKNRVMAHVNCDRGRQDSCDELRD